MSQIILQFLEERKAGWIKDKIKKGTGGPEEEKQIHQDAAEKFAMIAWVTDAAKRASQLTMSSHLSKFSHPSAKTSPVIAHAAHSKDGYVRTGNVQYELDVFGNAAALDVYKFLMLDIEDGKTVFDHLEEDSAIIKSIFANHKYLELKQSFMNIKQPSGPIRTDRLVKQVYFPVGENYHLLSVLTASGLITQIKERIDRLHFSDEAKAIREKCKNNEYSEQGYEEILGLTVTAFGGTQPQNISVLNSKNAGRAYLLASIPPKIEHRNIRLPSVSFFKNTLFRPAFRRYFEDLNKFIQIHKTNKHIRNALEKAIRIIIDQVLECAFKVRDKKEGWSDQPYYSALPESQRIWLDNAYEKKREVKDEDLWLQEISGDFARWIITTYEYFFKENKVMLGDGEWKAIKNIISDTIKHDQGFLR